MKLKTFGFSVIFGTLCGAASHASDCIGTGCIIEEIGAINQRIDKLSKPTELPTVFIEDRADVFFNPDELLVPYKPKKSLWTDQKIEMAAVNLKAHQTVTITDGCPFETDAECKIWRRKPMVNEIVSKRSNKMRVEKMNAFLDAICINPDLNATDPAAAPFLDRYKMLMRSANTCCTGGMAYGLKNSGATDGFVYKTLVDDANFYQFGSRCLMMGDAEFDAKHPDAGIAMLAADVRNTCLCANRDWFDSLLSPFRDAYISSPEFSAAGFNYTYIDGLQREITVSINNDVKNVLELLHTCP